MSIALIILYILLLLVVIVGIFTRPIFKFFYPLFHTNKWQRKIVKVIINDKKTYLEITEELSKIYKERDNEEKQKIRLQKLKKLNENYK